MNGHSAFCADIGSIPGKKFGWSKLAGGTLQTGTRMENLAIEIAKAITNVDYVSIGFECPLFVPVRENPESVASARSGEGNRSWSAGAGTGALATGMVEILWIMNRVRSLLGYAPKPVFDWREFLESKSVFLWEAFVTAKAKGHSDRHDAEIALRKFLDSTGDIKVANAITEEKVLSLIGACALRAEWTRDVSILWKPCLVIKA